jgi:hypothetical protein
MTNPLLFLGRATCSMLITSIHQQSITLAMEFGTTFGLRAKGNFSKGSMGAPASVLRSQTMNMYGPLFRQHQRPQAQTYRCCQTVDQHISTSKSIKDAKTSSLVHVHPITHYFGNGYTVAYSNLRDNGRATSGGAPGAGRSRWCGPGRDSLKTKVYRL